MSNPRSLIVAALILMVGACGGDTTGPARGSGVYRLATVNGMPVPYSSPPSTGLSSTIVSGDLYLRPDGTFGLGVQCTCTPPPFGECTCQVHQGPILEGVWRRDGSTLHLTGHGGADIDAELRGDSVMVTFGGAGPVYVFRRDRRARVSPAPVAGTYIMTALMGRPDLTYEYTIEGRHYTYQILYDTLTVIDDVFFRRKRAEITVSAAADTFRHSFTAAGGFDVDAETLVLRHYAVPAPSAVPRLDSLRILQDGLERHHWMIDPTTGQLLDRRETYTRLR
ncbi:MAG TPA: hypothetical protein VIL18_11260 [Longimicrobiales bacterium]